MIHIISACHRPTQVTQLHLTSKGQENAILPYTQKENWNSFLGMGVSRRLLSQSSNTGAFSCLHAEHAVSQETTTQSLIQTSPGMGSFMRQLGQAAVPHYFIKHYSRCYCEGTLQLWLTISWF